MSLLRKFQDLNNFIYNENYYKLIFGKTHIGYVHSKIAKHIILNIKDVYLLEKNIYLENTSEIKVKKIILDPVMIAKGGARLIDEKAIKILKKELIKKVDLITPNIPEAEVLTEMKINTVEDMILAANKLIVLGAKNVLIKGGHLNKKKLFDIFLSKKDFKIFESKKFITKNTHGTGCTLSSAITTFYSCGKSIKKSCELAIKYVNSAIKSNPKLGKGHGPINHLNSILVRNL